MLFEIKSTASFILYFKLIYYQIFTPKNALLKEGHLNLYINYQEALVTPGNKPW